MVPDVLIVGEHLCCISWVQYCYSSSAVVQADCIADSTRCCYKALFALELRLDASTCCLIKSGWARPHVLCAPIPNCFIVNWYWQEALDYSVVCLRYSKQSCYSWARVLVG